jgi:hypothetical protein
MGWLLKKPMQDISWTLRASQWFFVVHSPTAEPLANTQTTCVSDSRWTYRLAYEVPELGGN